MRYELAERLQGSPQSYWMLRIFDYDHVVIHVHTGKKLAYLQKILARYKRTMDFSL